MSKGTSCLQITPKKSRKKVGKCVYTEREKGKANVENVNIWGSWMKGTWEFLVLFIHVFCKSEKRAPFIQGLSCEYRGMGF